MRIAIIGAGISGLTAAYLLHRDHEITVFESEPDVGGHTATKSVYWQGEHYQIDTGFIVFNDWTYPNFNRLLEQIQVPFKPTDMGFSVSSLDSGIEYSGASLKTLFAQPKNLLSLSHWGMLKDILRFNKQSIIDVDSGRLSPGLTLGEYLRENRYGERFISHYLVPMGAAIWSASIEEVEQFPLLFFVRFFKNHGLLSVNDRPQWSVIEGGSKSYLAPLTAGFRDRIISGTKVMSVQRTASGVEVMTAGGSTQQFDQVVIAAHSDQALALLKDASVTEKEVLGAIAYRENEVVLHTDDSILPKKKSTWSSWNYRLEQSEQVPVLTYNMNILQGIDAPVTFCVTLNKKSIIDPSKVIGTYHYAHPVFSLDAIAAQNRWAEINGVNKTWFCGAYWANGFHEDGVVSALRVASEFGIEL